MPPPGASAETDSERLARETKEEMERRLRRNPSGDTPAFPLWKRITDEFTDLRTGHTDWAKVAVAGMGGVVAGGLAIGTGPIGMAVAALAGTALTGTLGVLLLNWVRGKPPEPDTIPSPPLPRAPSPDPNERVLGKSQIRLPEVKPVDAREAVLEVPVYNREENPKPLATRAEIEKWRRIIKVTGNPDSRLTKDATNWLSRKMIIELESSASQNEINLRYLNDEFMGKVAKSAEPMAAYLKKLGPRAEAALSVDIMPMLRKQGLQYVPGKDIPFGKDNSGNDRFISQFGEIGDNDSKDELEAYGRLIKEKLLKEMAAERRVPVSSLDVEDVKMVNKSWDQLNVISKRNLIGNFAEQAIFEALVNPTDFRHFFPENEVNLRRAFGNADFKKKVDEMIGKKEVDAGIFLRPGLLNPVNWFSDSLEDRFANAYVNKDLPGMAAVLKQRLEQDDNERDNKDIKESNKLTPDARAKMAIFVRAFEAYDKKLKLDRYMEGTLSQREIPTLTKFEDALLEHEWHVSRVKKRMEAFARGGSRFLVLDESQWQDRDRQTFEVLDTRTSRPVSIRVEITYDSVTPGNGPRTIKSITVDGVDKTDKLTDKTVPAGDIGRLEKLQAVLSRPDVLAAAASPEISPPDLSVLLGGQPAQLNGVSATPDSAPPMSSELWRLPVNSDQPGPDKER